MACSKCCPRMWEPLQRYRVLDSESQRLFRRAAILLPWIRVSLRLRGYQATFVSLQRRSNGVPEAAGGANEPAQKTNRMIHAAVRHAPLHFTCLEESLCLWYLLRKQGIVSQLRIGVRKAKEKFEAHAWVEYEGQALNQPEATHLHYAAFDKEFSEPPEGAP
jgi:hypothetical protein